MEYYIKACVAFPSPTRYGRDLARVVRLNLGASGITCIICLFFRHAASPHILRSTVHTCHVSPHARFHLLTQGRMLSQPSYVLSPPYLCTQTRSKELVPLSCLYCTTVVDPVRMCLRSGSISRVACRRFSKGMAEGRLTNGMNRAHYKNASLEGLSNRAIQEPWTLIILHG